MDISVNAGVFRRLGASFEFLGAFMESSASMEMQTPYGRENTRQGPAIGAC